VTVPNSTSSVGSVVVWSDGLENNVPTTPISSAAPLNTGAAKLAFTTQPPTTTTGGAPFPVTVALQDASSNTITTGAGSTAQVTLSLSGGTSGAALTCDQASNTMAGVAGVAAFTNCKIDKVGTGYVITASSPGATSIASNTVAITLGAAAKLGFTTQPPASTVAGVAFAAQPVVAVEDAGGNVVTTNNTTMVTLSVNPGSIAAGGFSCTTNPVQAASGVATFVGCKVTQTGTGTFLAQATGLNQATSASYAITPAAAAAIAFTSEPSATATAGAAFAAQPVVKVQDAFGNTVTSDNATTITLTYNGAGALTCTTNPVTVAAGVATFAGCKVSAAGSGVLTATSAPGLNSPVADTTTIVVS
jgi:YD repeat-containing protein